MSPDDSRSSGAEGGKGQSQLVHTLQGFLTGSLKNLVWSNKADFVILSSSECLEITRSKEVMATFSEGSEETP